MNRYIFRAGKEDDVERLIKLVSSRMEWMDRMGIDQWNNSHYDERYPREYYIECMNDNRLFVLEDTESRLVVAAGVLFEYDPRWGDIGGDAFYLHHLVADENAKGSGRIYVLQAYRFAEKMGKEFLRLDSKKGNQKLEEWYSDLGFKAVGHCSEQYHEGILRQIPI